MLHELRLWLVGGSEPASSLGSVCELEALSVDDWRDRAWSPAPAFLLVEAIDEVEGAWGGELDRLLEGCARCGVPRFLWLKGDFENPYWLGRLRSFDRVFAVKRRQLPELAARGARETGILWSATALPVEAEPADDERERTGDVVWLGGWNPDWPEAWRDRLTSVLRGAARRGLSIVPIADLDALPGDLRPFVAPTPPRSAADREAALGRARVAIRADAVAGAVLLAPQAVFDAAACGAAVVTPHDFAGPHDFSILHPGADPVNLLPTVRDGDTALEEIDRLLGDEQLRREVAGKVRRIVAYNHTYAHRVAMLASAAGHRIVP